MKKLVYGACALLLTAGLSGCGNAIPAASSETDAGASRQKEKVQLVNEMNLVLGTAAGKGSLGDTFALYFKEEIETASDGRITVDVYNSGILGSDLEMVQDCRYGTVDIQLANVGAVNTVIPQGALFDMPFLFDREESARTAMKNPEVFEYYANACKEQDLILIALMDCGFRNLSLSIPAVSLEELEGLTIRCLNNDNQIAFWQDMGLDPIAMDIADVYLALQKGGITGQENPYDTIYTDKLYEVQKYMTNSRHLLHIDALYFSKITWDSLSATSQQLLREAAQAACSRTEGAVEEANQNALERMQREGIKLLEFDALRGELRQRCQQNAYERIAAVTGTEMLDIWCAMGDHAP